LVPWNSSKESSIYLFSSSNLYENYLIANNYDMYHIFSDQWYALAQFLFTDLSQRNWGTFEQNYSCFWVQFVLWIGNECVSQRQWLEQYTSLIKSMLGSRASLDYLCEWIDVTLEQKYLYFLLHLNLFVVLWIGKQCV
jgi:hypothetical protein